jgi:subtilisin family serine protease
MASSKTSKSSATQSQRYLILPPRGVQASASPTGAHVASVMRSMSVNARSASKSKRTEPPRGMKVLDSIHDDGIKLVSMDAAALRQLRERTPGLRVVPEVFFRMALAPMPQVHQVARKPARKAVKSTAKSTALSLVDDQGHAVAGAQVVAFTDLANNFGAQGKTNRQGKVTLRLGNAKRVERLLVSPAHTHWSLVVSRLAWPPKAAVVVESIKLSTKDALQHFAQRLPGREGQGVTVGIIDTGSGPHRDLPIAGGANTVTGESAGDFEDNGMQHGTHVAGIVGARGLPGSGMRGLAPQCTLRSYRVFGQGAEGASNFAIAKAIDAAVRDGCDIINMSLGGGPPDLATGSAMAEARGAGVAVICAAGNDGEPKVDHPGADPRAVAVGAFGRQGTAPKSSVSALRVGRRGRDKRNFMADFSNYGPAIDFAGPGVGVVSTVPGNRWAALDGTSMASPALAGAAARLLSAHPALMQAPRNQQRSDGILQLVFEAAKALGFGPEWEGSGWPSR